MISIELNMVVPDSVEALSLYEKIFDNIERIEVTSFDKGHNEAVFTLHGMRIHMLDENPPYGLIAPKPGVPQSMWLNVIVPDIQKTYDNAINAGCTEIAPITEMDAHGVKNAMFCDPFGCIWLIHEVVREVSFEDRVKANEQMIAGERV